MSSFGNVENLYNNIHGIANLISGTNQTVNLFGSKINEIGGLGESMKKNYQVLSKINEIGGLGECVIRNNQLFNSLSATDTLSQHKAFALIFKKNNQIFDLIRPKPLVTFPRVFPSFVMPAQVFEDETNIHLLRCNTQTVDINQSEDRDRGTSYDVNQNIKLLQEDVSYIKSLIIEEKTIECNNDPDQPLLWLAIEGNNLVINNTITYHTFRPQKTRESESERSMNQLLMEYLLKNANRKISREELYSAQVFREGDDKSLKQCLKDMKFKEKWADLFFEVSNDFVMLINPVTQCSKVERGIDNVVFSKIVLDTRRQ